jgi:hypothetical protein
MVVATDDTLTILRRGGIRQTEEGVVMVRGE